MHLKKREDCNQGLRRRKRICILDGSRDCDGEKGYLGIIAISVPGSGLGTTISFEGDGGILTVAGSDDDGGVVGEKPIELPGFGSRIDPILKPLDDKIVELFKELQVELYGVLDTVGKESEKEGSTAGNKDEGGPLIDWHVYAAMGSAVDKYTGCEMDAPWNGWKWPAYKTSSISGPSQGLLERRTHSATRARL